MKLEKFCKINYNSLTECSLLNYPVIRHFQYPCHSNSNDISLYVLFGTDEHDAYFQNLKLLIEETYEKNDKKKIILIVHSLGGPLSLIFLQRQTSKWKEQYIRFQISLSGAWAGSVKAVESYIKGKCKPMHNIRTYV